MGGSRGRKLAGDLLEKMVGLDDGHRKSDVTRRFNSKPD
jgi:hypothetical protein